MIRCRTIAIVLLLLIAAGPSGAQESLEKQASRIEGLLMAPCCMMNPVSDHYSGAADRMRQEIRQMLAQGRTEQQILDHYVAQHGEQILAMPPASGFNLLAWLLPGVMLVAGCALVWVAARRWRSAPAEAELGGDAAPIDPEYAERLKRELSEMG